MRELKVGYDLPRWFWHWSMAVDTGAGWMDASGNGSRMNINYPTPMFRLAVALIIACSLPLGARAALFFTNSPKYARLPA